MFQWFTKQPEWFKWIVALLAIALFLFGCRWAGEKHREPMYKEVRQLMLEDKCKRTGFAGKSSLSVYTCDSGLYLYEHLEQKAWDRLDK